ncbi:MAG: hypothetical protein JWM28_1100, partial [Chitinophagaceae bacterium]|nr:hypothetical protein [Chitinophagaceae bacterium]
MSCFQLPCPLGQGFNIVSCIGFSLISS